MRKELAISFTLFLSLLFLLPADGRENFNPKEYWAVLIGETCYAGVPLPYSINQISEFKDILLTNRLIWKESHIYTLGDAKKEDVIDAINWLSARADENDISIFYFVGHGIKNSTREFLLTVDGKIISDKELDEYLDKVQGKIIIIIDTCYSGGFIEELKQENRVILTACMKNEKTYQIKELKSGIFGFFLNKNLKYLTKSAEMTFAFASAWSIWYSGKLSEKLNKNYRVHPQLYDGTDGLTYIIYRHAYLKTLIEGVFYGSYRPWW